MGLDIPAIVQRSASVNVLRSQIAGQVLGHLAALDVSNALAKATDEQQMLGQKGPVQIELNVAQSVEIALQYATLLCQRAGVA